ncbi:MAG: hypothetical protein K940chlam7_00280 [Chlamydiae bacterium]|nr:hypothetical protein [Chlamydiota bacterium]
MRRRNRWVVVLLLTASLQLSVCQLTVDATDTNRITLNLKTAKVIGIKTTPVTETTISRKQIFGGEVITLPLGAEIGVRVGIKGREHLVSKNQTVNVVPIAQNSDAPNTEAQAVNIEDGALYYSLKNRNHSFKPGQRVLVEVSQQDDGIQRKVIPYASVIYDEYGKTWIYTNPEPLVFIRQQVTIDHIDGDLAALLKGPDTGTDVVTFGASMLSNIEFENKNQHSLED